MKSLPVIFTVILALAVGGAFAAGLPAVPGHAQVVEAFVVLCPDGSKLTIIGYDTNGNGDYEIAEVARGETGIALIYFDAATEQTPVKLVVVEQGVVREYTVAEALAKYPNMCDLPVPVEATQT